MNKRRKRRRNRSIISPDGKRTVAAVLIWTGTAVLAAVFALIIGNVLGNKADKINNNPSVPAAVYQYNGEDIQPVNAHYLSIDGHTNESFSAAVAGLTSDVRAVSLYLRNNASPAYDSEVYRAVVGSAEGVLNLSAAVELLHSKNIYVSCCYRVGTAAFENSAGADAAVSFETAMIGEIADAGVDDIVILSLPSDSSGIASVSEMFNKIRREHSDVVLGAGISYSVLLSDKGAASLLGYSDFADFCAVDTEGCRAAGTNALSVAQSLLYSFKAYPLRLMFEISDDNDRLAQENDFRQLGIDNIQAAYKTVFSGGSVG